MKSQSLYNQLEVDFKLSICHDDWRLDNYEYITSQFKERSMGLVTDSTDTIRQVYTAVFPSKAVFDKILDDRVEEALLFVHHPMIWDITKDEVFTSIPVSTLKTLKERRISIYNLHVPLDANGVYGTTQNLANALGIDIIDEFYDYGGVKVGIIGKTDCITTAQLAYTFKQAVGHNVKLYPYGGESIKDSKVALIAGGGNDSDVYPYLMERGINTFVTGIASLRKTFQPSVDAHNMAMAKGVNILSGTHYSTEKFACIKLKEYFSNLGLPCEFIPDEPCMEDL